MVLQKILAHDPFAKRWPTLARVMVGRLVILACVFFALSAIIPRDAIAFYAFVALAFVVNIPYALWLRNEDEVRRGAPLQFLLDVLIITGLVHFTGGITSELVLLYPLVILSAGIVVSGLLAFKITVLSVLLYGLLVVLELFGVVPHCGPLSPYASPDLVIQSLMLRVFVFVFFSAASSYLADRLSAQAAKLGETRIVWEKLLDCLPIGLLGVSPEGKVVFANESAGRVLGPSPKLLAGRDLDEFLPAAGPEGAGADGEVRRIQRSDGTVVSAICDTVEFDLSHVRVTPTAGEGGAVAEPVRLLVLRDVTSLLRSVGGGVAAEPASATGMTVPQMAAKWTHDLNNRISVLQGASDMLMQSFKELEASTEPPSPDQRRFFRALCETIVAGSRQLTQRIEELRRECEASDTGGGLVVGGRADVIAAESRPSAPAPRPVSVAEPAAARPAVPFRGPRSLGSRADEVRAEEAPRRGGEPAPAARPPKPAVEPRPAVRPEARATAAPAPAPAAVHVPPPARAPATMPPAAAAPVAATPGAAAPASATPAGPVASTDLRRPGGPRVVVADDDAQLRNLLALMLRQAGYNPEACSSGEEALEKLRHDPADLVITDLEMGSGMTGIELVRAVRDSVGIPAIVMTAHSTLDNAINAMREGAFDFVRKPLKVDELMTVVSAALRHAGEAQGRAMEADVQAVEYHFELLVGESPPMQHVYRFLHQTAALTVPIVVQGERGTGKTMVAQVVHRVSRRSPEALRVVDCSRASATALREVLSGRSAQPQTVVLDGIERLSVDLQRNLTQFLLAEYSSRAAGDSMGELGSGARLIATSREPLADAVEAGRFDQDLLHCVAVLTVDLPPLRRRLEDLPLLVRHLCGQAGKAQSGPAGLQVDASVLDLFRRYSWPGNVAELEQVITMAAMECQAGVIRLGDLPPNLTTLAASMAAAPRAASKDPAQGAMARKLLQETQAGYLRGLRPRKSG